MNSCPTFFGILQLHADGTVFRPGTNIASRPAHFLTFESVECDIQQATPVAKRPILVSLKNSHGAVSRSLAYLVYHEDCYSCDSNLRCTRKVSVNSLNWNTPPNGINCFWSVRGLIIHKNATYRQNPNKSQILDCWCNACKWCTVFGTSHEWRSMRLIV